MKGWRKWGYFCLKCERIHDKKSKIGIDHRKHEKPTRTKKGMWSRSNPTRTVKLLRASNKFHLVIDIGCGPGRNMVFPISVGLDVDERAVERARVKGPVILGDAHHLPFKDDCCDHALLCYVINFVEDPSKVMSEACRISRRRLSGLKNPLTLVHPAKQALHKEVHMLEVE